MGSKIMELFDKQVIDLKDLKGKVLVVDTYNQLYMFLSSIRQADGTLLLDSKGEVTSHLSGLFTRFTRLMREGVRFIFVFDGKPPELKLQERHRRRAIKQSAAKAYEEAKEAKDLKEMRKYASRTSELTKDMIEDAKRLITALGMPWVQAPEEGEAQAAHIVKESDAYAVLSQDADSLMFGAPRVVRNLTITQRRKRTGAQAYQRIEPELVSLTDNLNKLGLDQDQLIVLSLLTGTDYNVGGIKGIGPKKALALVTKHGKQFDDIFKEAGWDATFSFPWNEAYDTIKHARTTTDYSLDFKAPDKAAVMDLLVDQHDFSPERVKKTLDDLDAQQPKEQTLNKWF